MQSGRMVLSAPGPATPQLAGNPPEIFWKHEGRWGDDIWHCGKGCTWELSLPTVPLFRPDFWYTMRVDHPQDFTWLSVEINQHVVGLGATNWLGIDLTYHQYGHHFEVARPKWFAPPISQLPQLVGPRDTTEGGLATTLFQLLRNGLYVYPLPMLNLRWRQGFYTGILRVAVAPRVIPWNRAVVWDPKCGITKRECPEGGCPQPPPPPDERDPPFMWSEASSWLTGSVPEEGDDVFIDSAWHVIVDESPPCMGELHIYGLLEIGEGTAILCMQQVAVYKYGILRAGSPAEPFPHDLVILLHGVERDPVMVMAEGLFLHNKVLAVVGGDLELHGLPVQSWTQLAEAAEAGASSIRVVGDASAWAVGEKVVVGATEFPSDGDQTEPRLLAAEPIYYAASKTSVLALDEPLYYTHSVEQVPYRGEIRTLSAGVAYIKRSIVVSTAEEYYSDEGPLNNVFGRRRRMDIYGAHSVGAKYRRPHHGQVVIGGDESGEFYGRANFSYVEFRELGQRTYKRPMLFFDYLGRPMTSSLGIEVHGCTFHRAKAGYAVKISNAAGVRFTQNVFHANPGTGIAVHNNVLDFSFDENCALGQPPGSGRFAVSFELAPAAQHLRSCRGNYVGGATTAMAVRIPCGQDASDVFGDPRYRDENVVVASLTGFHARNDMWWCAPR
jgi:hypothetical protein